MTDTDTRRGRSFERDWPEAHPSSSDYQGESYTPPPPPFAQDWHEGHPARLGANVPHEWDEARTPKPSPAPTTDGLAASAVPIEETTTAPTTLEHVSAAVEKFRAELMAKLRTPGAK